MKINSNTIAIAADSEEYKALESIVSKIAQESKIANVKIASISLSQDSGTISFKLAEDEEEVSEEKEEGSEEKEETAEEEKED